MITKKRSGSGRIQSITKYIQSIDLMYNRLVEGSCSVQRRYIWTIEQLHRILISPKSDADCQERLTKKLGNLTLETLEQRGEEKMDLN